MPITRRQFASMLAAGAAPPQDRWNVLLITNDQHRADCLGAMGNPVIRTPRLDRLAQEGVLFERLFAQCPQCVPSRSALHTGRYPHVNRTPSNLFRLPPGEETLATLLDQNGYVTAAVGELPFAPTKFLGGFQTVVASDPEYHAFQEARGWRGSKLTPERQALLEQYRQRSAKQFQAAPVPWPEELDETAFFAARAVEFLKAHRDRPFFLHVNFRRPHHPFDPPPPFDRMYEGARFPPSHRREGEMENKPPSQKKYLAQSVGFDLRTMTDRDLDRIKSHYYGMISLNDKYIGLMLDTLAESGLDSRTLVVFTSDHGEMLGDHGLLFKGGYFYDEVVRVPLIIRAPGKLPAVRRVGAMAETIDILPTILELLDLPVPSRVQGRSLMRKTSQPAHAEFANIKMIRTEDWKLVHYLHAPHGELYNLREDPHELYNLYDDPSAAPARRQMQAALTDWLIDSEDPLLKPLPAGD
ncbi:MAG: sulfatase-like hydrolase/transferase [Acidobacteriota bacterium]